MTTFDDKFSPHWFDLAFDLRSAVFFQKDNKNFILRQTAEELPIMQNLGVYDVYLNRGHSVELHWHPNANELLYMIRGELRVAIFDPFNLQILSYDIKPPQTVYIPMGWLHWAVALTDQTHVLAIFDNNIPQIIYMSNILRIIPPEVFQEVYGLDAAQFAEVLKPIKETVVIGPPNSSDIRWRIGGKSNY